jgi:hypothetical protein
MERLKLAFAKDSRPTHEWQLFWRFSLSKRGRSYESNQPKQRLVVLGWASCGVAVQFALQSVGQRSAQALAFGLVMISD